MQPSAKQRRTSNPASGLASCRHTPKPR
jgi:hypothetical protein